MPVTYCSTRGKQKGLSFEDVVLGGLATDGGLYIPENIPSMSLKDIEKMRGMTYFELAFEVLSKFISESDIPHDTLREIVNKSFSTFRTPDVTPCLKLKEFWVLELFHGPTFAFKDVALQFLGNLFEFFLLRGNQQKSITILGATSGDTGSAAIHGLRGKINVNCFILYPRGKVTEIQERQMTTIPDPNVHCINIDGNFDDAQAIVKSAFADEKFRKEVNLGAINSINWARVLAQITYYFYAWLRVTDNNGHDQSPSTERINFAVPTGNFGDILAGYYAKLMGLPVGRLVICANENDVLHRFLQEGTYSKKTSRLTIAPSMDISVSSNFERYLYYLSDRNTSKLASWMSTFESTGLLTLPDDLIKTARSEFASYSSSETDIVTAMTSLYKSEKYLVCPHTATAVVAVRTLGLPATNTVILATAHPAKFEEAVGRALQGQTIPPRPAQLEVLFFMPTRTIAMQNSLADVQKFMRMKLGINQSISKFVFSRSFAVTFGVLAAVGFSFLFSSAFAKRGLR
eukprot:gene6823-13822_t